MAASTPDRPYQAVLFDAGQTLLRVHPSVGAVYAAIAARYGVETSSAALEAAFRTLWRSGRHGFPDDLGYATSEAQERTWWRGIVEGVFIASGALPAFGDRFDTFFDEVFEHFAHPEPWQVFEDVCPCLDALDARGLRRGIVSNWDQRLPILLERLNLRPRFEFVLTSAEVGRRKPHRFIFDCALARLALPASQVVYIGDSYDDDVLGAQAAGMTPLLIDRRKDGLPSEGWLRRLDDLPRWLETHGAG